MKQISKTPLTIPVQIKVWQNYDALDNYAKKLGYSVPENCPTSLTGWIATMGDEIYDPKTMLAEANQKLLNVQQIHKKDAIIGLCQTGNFSVGYTIYVKDSA